MILILEWIESLFASTISTGKQFGHVKESIAILARYKRCHFTWKSHLENCHREIENFSQKISQKKTLLILGSGPLHEIPIEKLLQNFETIYLVDAIHPKEVLKKYKDHPKIKFFYHDISEREAEIKLGNLNQKIPSKFLDEKIDAVISANLLSQIPFHIENYLIKNFPNMIDSQREIFCTEIARDHLTYLKKFQCPVLLITDIETQIIYPQKNLIEIESPYHEGILKNFNHEWNWLLAPLGEKSKQYYLQMKVVSIILNS